jgi:hypothetical protein
MLGLYFGLTALFAGARLAVLFALGFGLYLGRTGAFLARFCFLGIWMTGCWFFSRAHSIEACRCELTPHPHLANWNEMAQIHFAVSRIPLPACEPTSSAESVA